ncbi:MAG: transmembrane sensor [Oceanospirillaceae bacterium]|jgi:transmembrane sensor
MGAIWVVFYFTAEPPMKTQTTKNLITDSFNGNTSSIQQKMIARWLVTPENEEAYYEYLDEWESQYPQCEVDPSAALQHIKSNMEMPQNRYVPSKDTAANTRWRTASLWLVAASIVLVSSWLIWNNFSGVSTITYEKLVQESKTQTGDMYEKENLKQKALLVNLPDGSSVLLQPKARLSYSPSKFNRDIREVMLSGEAFFEVKKDKEKPFIVYANNLVAKVLGTSFTVKATAGNGKTELFVKTGKVSIFTQKNLPKNHDLVSTKLEGTVLQQNQQVALEKNDKVTVKNTIESEQLSLPIQQLTFSFDDVSAVTVLEQLKTAYNIQIYYDRLRLKNCMLTAHLLDEPLLEKLKMVCFALDANFE